MDDSRGVLGRAGEREALDRMLANVRGGDSGVLVITGEAGIGKTALVRYAAQRASGLRIAQIAGIQAELELPYAGVHQLCVPLLAGLDGIPAPQREALSVAFGISPGDPPDRFMVGLAVLSLLSAVAEERPLVCVVDDAQWLDDASADVLAFVARRLLAESVALLFAVRKPPARRELDGLPELALGGLEDEAAHTLLARALPGRVDRVVRDRIVAEARGNPLALLELPRSMTAAELAGGFVVSTHGDLPERIEDSYRQRIAALPEVTQQLILLAAADPVGDAALVWRAAERLGISVDALAPAENAELLEIRSRVRFHHPLVRSAVYRAASPDERQRAHEALAHVSDSALDADRRAWHRALATTGLDEDVGAELERSAGRAQTRGGLAAAAAFLERAAGLTPDPERRARRALAAAHAKHQAGATPAALALLAAAEAGPLDELQLAQGERLRAQIAFTSSRGSEASRLLLNAARRLESLDVTLARETYLEALMAAQVASRFASATPLEIAQAARSAPQSPTPTAPDLLLDGLAVLITEGHRVGAPLVQRALSAFLRDDMRANGGFRWLLLAGVAAIEVWDYETWRELTVRELQLIRDAGALTALSTSLSVSIFVRVFAGELAAAAALIDEQRLVTEASGSKLGPHGPIMLAGWRGDQESHSGLMEETIKEAVPRGEGVGLSAGQWAGVVLLNGLGHYDRALALAHEVLAPPRAFDQTINWVLPELIEAAARTGHEQAARVALERLCEMTQAAGSDWGLGLESRSRALLAVEHREAERLYRQAIEQLGRTRIRGEHARAHLLYGEWLRRQRRRTDARDQLRTAHEMFSEMGMQAFTERAGRELLATGESVRKRAPEARDDLTSQEAQVARMARDGLSNAEIGARLFLSPRTVEWHMRQIFGKLGIRSRRELARALPNANSGLLPA